MNQIKPYRQTLSHSCLVACFLMLLQSKYQLDFTESDEEKLAVKGSKRTYPFYVAGVTAEITKNFKKDIKVIVDNKFFAGVLSKVFNDIDQISINVDRVNIKNIEKYLKYGPLICHVDIHGLGDYSHSSHFIVVEDIKGEKVGIIDPLSGKKSYIGNSKLVIAIQEVRGVVKMSPLLFYLA